MAIRYAEEPERYQGTGTVFIAEDDGEVHGYWDGAPDNGNMPIEEMPAGFSRREAAEWGLNRTSRVYIRFEGDGYYAVGTTEPPDLSPDDDSIIGSLTVNDLGDHGAE